MRAVIMAGGIGSRLQPITSNIPKPMVRILGKPVMEYTIEKIAKAGIKEVDITLRYLPQEIINYFGNGKKYGLDIKYHIEKTPLGTAGSVFDAIKGCDDEIMILSGDAIFDIDLNEFIEFYKAEEPMAAMCIKRVEIPTEFGVVVCDNTTITRFIEKPNWAQVSSDDVNTGIYILSSEVLKYDNGVRPLDFSKDVFKKMMEDKRKISAYNLKESYWCDIGTPNDYIEANIYYLGKKSSRHRNSSNIIEPCYVSRNAKIDNSSTVGENVYIEKNASIGKECTIKNSVIMQGCKIKDGVVINGSIICENSIIHNNSIIEKGAIVGNSCEIGDSSVLQGSSIIYPDTKIPSYSMINSRIDKKGLKSVINTINEGKVNGRLALNECSELGYILGNIAGEGKKVAVAHIGNDPQALCIMSGIIAAGANCVSVKGLAGYLFGNHVKSHKCKIGVYVCEGTEGAIYLVDDKGHKISSMLGRKIKDAIKRNSVNNVPKEKLGKVISTSYSASNYARKIEKFLANKADDAEKVNILFLGTKNVFGKRCFRFLEKYTDNKDAEFSLTLIDGGINYYIEQNGEKIDCEKFNKKIYMEKDALIKTIKAVRYAYQAVENANTSIDDFVTCPQGLKGRVMKSLYAKYGDILRADEKGIRINAQKCDISVMPHEVSPIINVNCTGEDKTECTSTTRNMINEIKDTIKETNSLN